MSNTQVFIGNLTHDVDLKFSNSGVAVANISIADTPRVFDKAQNDWKDGETVFIRGTLWRDAAENAAETLAKGQRVIAVGRLKQSNWEKDGEKRSSIELEIDEIGPSLKWATARVSKANRQGGQSVRATAGAAAGGGSPWDSSGTPNF